MSTPTVKLPNQNVPFAQFTGPNGKPVFVYITIEWYRALNDVVKTVNDLVVRVEALE